MKTKNCSRVPSGIFCLGIILAISMLTGPAARAVPYASGVVSNNNSVSFILNQEAQGLVVLRDGANPVYPGTAPGQHSFDMTGFTNFSIIVTGNTAKAWTKFVPDGTDRSFYLPRGVAINKNPASPNFGKVYVSESRGGQTANTTYGRMTADGIYVLRADGTAESGPYTGGVDWTVDAANASAPLRSVIGPDNHLYVVSLYSDLAFEFNDDLSVATPLIDASNRTEGQWVHSIWVEGTKAAGNRKLYLVNGNYLDGRRGLIGYDLGGNDMATPGDTGTQLIGPDVFNYYPYDVARDRNGDWYLNQYRATAGQALALLKFKGDIVPNNEPLWSVPNTYTYTESLDINDAAGVIAVGRYSDGTVYLFELSTGDLRESFDCGNRCREQAFDAAGNLVTVDNGAEWARFWSPGGYTIATTTSDGTFNLFTPDNLSVTSVADPAAAEEGLDPATFTITRVGGANLDLQVHFTLTGTAVSNVDYTVSPASPFTFPAGETAAIITITPKDDTERESLETVAFTLAASPDYYVTSQNTATVTITDNDAVRRYWDINGAQSGAGGPDANGNWADLSWNSNPDGIGAPAAWTPGATPVFSAGTDAFNVFTVTISGAQQMDGPIFEEGYVTLAGGTIQLANYDTIQVAPWLIATINSVVTGSNGLSSGGEGTLVLGGANTYTGPTVVKGGTLQLAASDRVPDNSALVVEGGMFDLNFFNETVGSLAGSAGGTLNLPPGSTLVFGGDNTDTIWNATNASVGGSLVKVGTGTTRMNAGGTGDANLVISNGVISVNSSARLGSQYDITIDNGATLESTSSGVGSDFLAAGKLIMIGAGGGTLKVADGGAILMVRDASVISGPGTLTKDGPGELRTYNAEHSFGKLIVKQGLWTAGHSTSAGYATSFGAIPAALAPDAITIQNGAQIRKAGGFNVTLDPKQGITLSAGGTIRSYAGNTDAGTFEIPGPISGTGPLVLGNTADAATIIVLSGHNTYTGGTTVNAGTTEVRADGGLGAGDVTVASRASLRLTGGVSNTYIHPEATLTLNVTTNFVDLAFTGAPNVIKALYINGVKMVSGTWGAVGSGATHEHAAFTGTGKIEVAAGVTPQPIANVTIGPVSNGACSISYANAVGSQFVLLSSPNVALPTSSWTRVATNTAPAGSFTIPIGSDPQGFYRIQSE